MSTPEHVQMGGEFQGIKSDSVNNNGQNIQYHIEAVTEHQKDNGKNHEHKIAKQRTYKLVYGSGDGCASQTDGPKSDIGNDVGENVDYTKQDRNDIGKACEDGLYNASLIVGEYKAEHEANQDKGEGKDSHGDAADDQTETKDLGIDDGTEYDIIHADQLEDRSDITENLDGFPVSPSCFNMCDVQLNQG